MLSAITRFFERLRRREVDQFIRRIDGLNAQAHGGKPGLGYGEIGELPVPSGSLVLTDPQDAPSPGVRIDGIRRGRVSLLGEMREYPDGSLQVRRLDMVFDPSLTADDARVLGEIGVESGQVIVADLDELQTCWASVGPERIGIISTARDDRVLKLLKKRFGLKVRQNVAYRAEVVGSVSVELEAAIEAYLKTIPEYAAFPFIYFRVDTNNSLERTGDVGAPGRFIPIGNQPMPEMLVCQAGRGDGEYEVKCEFAGQMPIRASIVFIDDE